MIIVMEASASEADLQRVLDRIEAAGGTSEIHEPEETLVSVYGCDSDCSAEVASMPGVAQVRPKGSGLWLTSRERRREDTVIEVSGRRVGGAHRPVIIAGPCAVESEDQLFRTAEAVKEAGADMLRGGAYKPRTSPYAFQGMGEQGLELLTRVRERFDLPLVSELRDLTTLPLFLKYEIDVIQIGARNMQNFEILRAVGEVKRPVLLKRGPANTIDEWLQAAEYLMIGGNCDVMLCERGIVPPAHSKTRYLLDLSAVPIARSMCHLPVIVDPSHSTGSRICVGPMAKGAVAAGANGLLIEVHNDPEHALCDGPQSITAAMLREMIEELRQRGYLPEDLDKARGGGVVRPAATGG
jgi:3-deoxy-7-phosphoheptulonate synthase